MHLEAAPRSESELAERLRMYSLSRPQVRRSSRPKLSIRTRCPEMRERGMPSPHRDPFAYDRPFYWSQQKLEILEKYAKAATPILAKIGKHRVTFVDLMAAGGYYTSGHPGSTGHFAQVAEANRAAGRNVRCIAYEIDSEMFALLQTNTAPARDFVTVRNAAWETQVHELLKEIEGDFVVFFIDPIGLREVSWEALLPIINRPFSELLINFPSTTAARLAGRWARGTQSAEGSRERLDTVFGGDSWMKAAAIEDGQLHEHLAESYADRVQTVGKYEAVFWQVIRLQGFAVRRSITSCLHHGTCWPSTS